MPTKNSISSNSGGGDGLLKGACGSIEQNRVGSVFGNRDGRRPSWWRSSAVGGVTLLSSTGSIVGASPVSASGGSGWLGAVWSGRLKHLGALVAYDRARRPPTPSARGTRRVRANPTYEIQATWGFEPVFSYHASCPRVIYVRRARYRAWPSLTDWDESGRLLVGMCEVDPRERHHAAGNRSGQHRHFRP